VVDITEQAIIENKKADELDIIKCGITEVVKAKENERIRTAGELHDNVNQLLGTARLFLSLINNNSDQIRDLLPKAIDLIDKSINETRNLSHSAFSSDHDNCSVIDEISEMAETIKMASGITVTFNHDNAYTCNLSDFEKLNVLRIIQEATNNIIKHANAGKITIDIKESNNKL
jgi:signal transduction histidine kinase